MWIFSTLFVALTDMNNFLPPDPNDPRIKLDSTLKKRKELQLINELEETDAMVETKEKIKELEAQEMREIMQVLRLQQYLYISQTKSKAELLNKSVFLFSWPSVFWA